MIDTAIPDMVGEGMINFDKRRKEFEVLAQVIRSNSNPSQTYITRNIGIYSVIKTVTT